MEKVEVAVIGAGVVGLAVARALSLCGKEVLILERAKSFGMETSSRNSEVVHGGLYYPVSSLKAKLCVEGRQLLYEYCDQRNIFCDPLGKLVVGTEKSHLPTLHKLLDQSKRNGYNEVRILSKEDVASMEPSLRTSAALWSPKTGVVDSHTFMLHLLGDAEENGACLATNALVEDARIDHENGGFGLYSEGIWLSCDYVINCAGLWADVIASKLHSRHRWRPPKQYFAKGNYFALTGPAPFRSLVYPVPDPKGGLGVHATLDRNKSCKFGPDVEWLETTSTADDIDYTPSRQRMDDFYSSIRTYWPDLPDDSLSEDYAGVRPKLSHPSLLRSDQNMPFQDFLIASPKEHGVAGLFHLLGIESPGLTASLAIANHIARQVK